MIIDVFVNNIKVNAIIDTGSSITAIYQKKYYEIDRCERPKLVPNHSNLRMPNVNLVVKEGQTVLPININGTVIEYSAFVANVVEVQILGFDFLKENNRQLHLGEGTLIIGNKKLPCDLNSDHGSGFKISQQEI